MHITIIKTKDGKEYSGFIMVFRPEEGWVSIVDGDNLRKFDFDDLASAVTKGERLSISKIGDDDEIEKARRYLKDGRKFNWFNKDIPVMKWEEK